MVDLSRVEVVLLDMDGTLTDSVSRITEYFAALDLELHGRMLPPDAYKKYVGPPLADAMRDMEPDADEQRVVFMVARYREMYWPNAIDVPLYPGIREMLEKLRARGYRLGVATTKNQQMSLEILQHLGIEDFFEVVSGVIPGTSRVDKPAVIAAALEQFGLSEPQDKRRIVMVGDRFYDIEGAQINGIPAILTTWGDTAQPGEERGAVQVVSTPAELLSALGVHPGKK